jgi:hypothetical protein
VRLRGTTFKVGWRRVILALFSARGLSVQDINPIVNQINDLKGRVRSLRGYL